MNEQGRLAEERALSFLLRQGLQLVERNWLCRGGEIDLIMRDGRSWVFVEVRHRASARFGGAAYSITAAKQRKLMHAAAVYLSDRGVDAPCRFDAVLSEGEQPLQWLKNIFA
ncbi:YraN family protein [Aquitalea sp. FJL05]|jgi:putative endonuclease|uniref:YraN family protein n=1 Tax=Aquitalea TaxID=407217 RepID=UPI000F591C43|nr:MULTISPECIES: YraN family protein [Aquitalea]RQO69170.1 YraN family protein [Aquitalea sp. FJL05]